MAATHEEQRAKLECARLLHETVYAKQAKFAVSGRAENIEREYISFSYMNHEFPTLPGLRIGSAAGIAGIDPTEALPLPLSKKNGELFFGTSDNSVSSSRLAADQGAAAVAAAEAASELADKDVAVLSGDARSFSITNPQFESTVDLLAVHAIKQMGIESEHAYSQRPTTSDVKAKDPKLLICRPSAMLSTKHYQHAADDDDEYIFASLLIQLPSDLLRSDGGISVSYGGVETRHEMGVSPQYYDQTAPYACHYLCHMRQCKVSMVPSHDINGLEGGYRVILAYNLEWRKRDQSDSARYCGKARPYPTLPPPTDKIVLREALQKLSPSDRVFVIPLDSVYYRKKVEESGIDALKPQHAAIIRAIGEAGGISMWKFRILLFDGFVHSTPPQPDQLFWYDIDGTLLNKEKGREEDCPAVNWSVYESGGNAVSGHSEFVLIMADTERYENQMSAAIVAYDGGSSTEINATGKFEEAAMRRCRGWNPRSFQLALDALDVNGVRPSASSLVEFIGRLESGVLEQREMSASALLQFYEIATKRQMMKNDEVIEAFIRASGTAVGQSFRKLMRNVLTASGSFGEHFLDIVQFSSSIEDDEVGDFFKFSMALFIKDSDPSMAKHFAEYIAKADTITQVEVIVALPSPGGFPEAFGNKLQTLQDELRKAMNKEAMETIQVLFMKDRSSFKRRHLFDTEQGRITIDTDSLYIFFFVAGKDILTRLTEWAWTASYEDLENLQNCLPTLDTPLPSASAQYLDESRRAIKGILESYLERHQQKKVTEPACTGSLRMPRAKHHNKKVQEFLRSEAQIGYVAVNSRDAAKGMVQSITGCKTSFGITNYKDDDTIMTEGYSAIAWESHRRNKFIVKVEKTERLRELELAYDKKWKDDLDFAEAYLAKLQRDMECCCQHKQKRPRL